MGSPLSLPLSLSALYLSVRRRWREGQGLALAFGSCPRDPRSDRHRGKAGLPHLVTHLAHLVTPLAHLVTHLPHLVTHLPPRIPPESTQNPPKIQPESTQSPPRIHPESTQNPT